jgi:hypothetical protein
MHLINILLTGLQAYVLNIYLKTFSTIHIIDSMEQHMARLKNGEGWASLYYGVFSKKINEKNSKVVCEVGCGYGLHTKHVLENTQVEKIYMIDPYRSYDDAFSDDVCKYSGKATPQEAFSELLRCIYKELEPHKNRYEHVRSESPYSSLVFNDGMFDAIFIDGDHTFQACLNDLRAWWPKVKQGGFLMGDDYWMPSVKNAVDIFASENNLTYSFHYKEGTDYKIYCFEKTV